MQTFEPETEEQEHSLPFEERADTDPKLKAEILYRVIEKDEPWNGRHPSDFAEVLSESASVSKPLDRARTATAQEKLLNDPEFMLTVMNNLVGHMGEQITARLEISQCRTVYVGEGVPKNFIDWDVVSTEDLLGTHYKRDIILECFALAIERGALEDRFAQNDAASVSAIQATEIAREFIDELKNPRAGNRPIVDRFAELAERKTGPEKDAALLVSEELRKIIDKRDAGSLYNKVTLPDALLVENGEIRGVVEVKSIFPNEANKTVREASHLEYLEDRAQTLAFLTLSKVGEIVATERSGNEARSIEQKAVLGEDILPAFLEVSSKASSAPFGIDRQQNFVSLIQEGFEGDPEAKDKYTFFLRVPRGTDETAMITTGKTMAKLGYKNFVVQESIVTQGETQTAAIQTLRKRFNQVRYEIQDGKRPNVNLKVWGALKGFLGGLRSVEDTPPTEDKLQMDRWWGFIDKHRKHYV